MNLSTVLIADLKARGHAIDQGLELAIRDALDGIMERDAEPKPVTDNGALEMALTKGAVDPTRQYIGQGANEACGQANSLQEVANNLSPVIAEGEVGSGV